jgi:hypothetical protein
VEGKPNPKKVFAQSAGIARVAPVYTNPTIAYNFGKLQLGIVCYTVIP